MRQTLAAAVGAAFVGLTATILAQPNGHAMVVIEGPMPVRMGSLEKLPAPDSAAEPLHTVTIPRSFAISTTEVTVAQFRRFLDANPDVKSGYRFADAPDRMAEVQRRFSPDDDSPAIAMTWYEAAMYCNWLSALDRLPPSEWVYPAGVLRDGFDMPANYLARRGYRLPTEPEWEYAARAGTTTARFFGDSDDALGEYAVFARHPPRGKDDPVDPTDPQRTQHVGSLKPNPLGLFDVYGNVWEWTQDRVERFQTAAVTEDREDPVLRVSDRDARTRRGGAYAYGAAFARSASRGPVTSLPTNRRDNLGFRVARTVLP
jgi:formylglycine-generating enzyme required for sulfatase activity